jgi:hypothetical protein
VLALSRMPFRRERPIPDADFTGDEAYATLGPWLGHMFAYIGLAVADWQTTPGGSHPI